MDPLSLTASIIAVFGAGGTIAKGLGKIRRLKRAPDVLLQLNNDVTDLHLLIRAVDELYRQRNNLSSASTLQEEVVCRTLERAKHAVLELEKLIGYILTKETNAGTEVNNLAWIRAVDRITETKGNIRAARDNLNTVWAALSNRHSSSRIELELQNVASSVTQLQFSSLNGENLSNQMTEAVWRRELLLETFQQEMCQNLGAAPSSEIPQPIKNVRTMPTVQRPGDATQLLESIGTSQGLTLSLIERRNCEPLCACSCHQQRHFRSPSFLDQTLGSLFIGYVGFPKLFVRCNMSSCYRHSISKGYLSYVFPKWFLEIAIFAKVKASLQEGPERLIRCVRVRQFITIPSFQALAKRQYDQVKGLILNREASVLDVDEGGASMLNRAIMYFSRSPIHRLIYFRFIELLLLAGADIFQESYNSFSAYALLWKLQVIEPTSLRDYPKLQCLLSTGDPSDIFGFSILHATLLQLDYLRTFEDQVALSSRDLIDQPDNTGRTALSWAAELGQIDKIRMLLMKGADPNKADSFGETPLSHCAYDTECLAALLESGSHVDHQDLRGYTKLMRLAIKEDNVACAKVLERFGANLNNKAIFVVVERYRPQLLTWMLEQGIDIEARNFDGETALLTIFEENADMLEALLKKSKPDCTVVDHFSEGLLHKVARFGNIQAMKVLQNGADLSDLDVERKSISGLNRFERSKSGKTALELAEWRRDHQSEWAIVNSEPLDLDSQAWFAAFKSFHEFIQAAYMAKRANSAAANLETSSGAAALPTEGIDSDQNMGTVGSTSTDLQMWPKVPGSYPRDDDE